jgi:hypothetical protein
VVVAIIGTAYLTLILTIVHYILVFDPAIDDFDHAKKTDHPNTVDLVILNFISKKVRRPSAKWESGLEKVQFS